MWPFIKSIIKPVLKFPVEHPKKWILIRSGAMAIPAVLFTFLRFDFGKPAPDFQVLLTSYLRGHQYLTLILLGAIVPLSVAFDVSEHLAAYIKEREQDHSPGLELSRTLAALSHIIGVKMEKLGDLAKKCNNRTMHAVSFQTVTSPDEQIREIVKQLWVLLAANCETQRFRITLVSTFDPNQYSFAAFVPQTEQPPNELLLNRPSFIRHVAVTKGQHCIHDIEKHINRQKGHSNRFLRKSSSVQYLEADGAANTGSICGFPIYDQGLDKVVYVLTIWHERPNFITAAFFKAQGEIMKHFFSRLLLEHRIKIIRDYEHTNTN